MAGRTTRETSEVLRTNPLVGVPRSEGGPPDEVPLVPLVADEPVELLWRLQEAEGACGTSDGGGVSSTVHVLVHLLGHLLRMAKVGGGHRHPAGHEHRDQDHKSSLSQ